MKIPKNLGQIWIGPKVAPTQWMETWKALHPSWRYTLYDNAFLNSGRFRTRPQIDEYMKRGWYAGAADLLRYEILFESGGYLAGADSICQLPIDELFEDGGSIYTVYENEFLRGRLVAPIAASIAGHPFLDLILDTLAKVPPQNLDHPWKQTGNLFIAELIEKHQPDIVIWPSHFLIPEHFAGRKYTGTGKVYARQMFGETNNSYRYKSWLDKLVDKRRALHASMARKRLRALKRTEQTD